MKLDEWAAAQEFVSGNYENVLDMICAHFKIKRMNWPIIMSSSSTSLPPNSGYLVICLYSQGKSFRLKVKNYSGVFDSWSFDTIYNEHQSDRAMVNSA